MQFKVFVNALRDQSGANGSDSEQRTEEKMFSYVIEAENSEDAKALAKSRFELEQGMKGWQVEAILTMAM